LRPFCLLGTGQTGLECGVVAFGVMALLHWDFFDFDDTDGASPWKGLSELRRVLFDD
jgi:hypothetical protein